MSKLGTRIRRPKIDIRFTANGNRQMNLSAIVNGTEYASETVRRKSKDMHDAERRVKEAARDKLRGEGRW